MITEILEEDFRKLNLKSKEINYSTHECKEVNLNDVLDEEINYAIECGYEEDRISLNTPVTVAIPLSEYCGDKFMPKKFMNYYYIALGIKHIYSTRDYYECKQDYWRVRKDETKVIYRIHLKPRPFVLKHKTEKEKINDNKWIEHYYDLIDDEWVETSSSLVEKSKYGNVMFTPIKKEDA